MHMLKYLSLAFIGSAIASPLVVKRDAATVTKDIGVVQQKVVALNKTVTDFDGSFFKALPVQIASEAVKKALNQTVTDAKASSPFDEQGSTDVALAILNLQPDIFSTLDNVVAKKPQFDKGKFLTPIVKQSLVDQRALAKQLGDAIVPLLTEDIASAAPGIIKDIDDKFAAAIAVYSQGGGFPGFPGFPSS